MKGPDRDEVLSKIPLFDSLSEEELDEIQRIILRKHFSKNEVVLHEEQTRDYMYVVFSGSVRVVQVSLNGKEQILAIHKGGDFFGEMALLDGKTLPANVIAMEECTVGLLSKHDFGRCLLSKAKVRDAIIMMLCQRLREAWLRLRVLGFADAEHRVREVLRLLGMEDGLPCQTGTLINLRLTHLDIANYASVSRETASRLLSRFSNDGEIEINGTKQMILKPIFLKNTPIL